MKPLIPKPSTTFWLSLKHTSLFSSYLTAGEYLTVSNAPPPIFESILPLAPTIGHPLNAIALEDHLGLHTLPR